MTESKKASILDPEDDAPDLSTPGWREAFAKAPVQRGRPKVDNPKVSTTIRLDNDVLQHFQKDGDGWQTRINEALRAYAFAPKTKKRARKSSKAEIAVEEAALRKTAKRRKVQGAVTSLAKKRA